MEYTDMVKSLQNVRMVKVIVAFIIIHWCLLPSAAQTVKPITVSQQASYTDHITLKADASDKDLMVKFVFNEANNTLSVRLLSYRTLFVFWDKTRYKGTIRRRWIRPDRLSYVVTSNPEDRFRLTKAFCKSLPQPYKKHVFRKWIEYEGLQPTDTALQMVNDYIEQTFNIQGKRNNVTIRLRDLMLMDEVRHKGNGSTYEVSFGKDLNTEYQVTIERNPCFGLEGQVASAQQSLAAVSKSWATFKKRYGKGTVPSDETMKNFRDLKATLVQQFPVNTDDSPCPDVLQAYEQYNQIVDSLTKMKVTVQQADVIGQTSIVFDTKDRAKNAKVVFANARQIDSMVSRWLTSRDELERADLVSQCRSIIKDTDIILKSGGILTPEERNAANIFRQAEKYFNKTCR